MLFIGPQLLSPSAQGTIATVTRVEHKLVTSIIGGPTQVVATLKNIVSAEETPFALNRLTGTNIWITNITLPQSGTFTVTITAIDGAQNYTSAVVSTLQAATAFPLQDTTGKSLDGTISIYAQDTETGNFLPWDSNPFGQRNPVTVKNDESFTAVLPGGTYYLEVKAPGYRTIQTHKFTLSQPTALTPSFVVTSVPSIRLFGIRISLPSLTREYITLPSVDSPTLEESHSEPLPFPTITLRNAELELSPDTLESATTLVTFLNTWSVQTPSQLNELTRFMEQHPDVSIMVVVPHETASAVELFLKRGNYSLPMIADPDGELADALDYHTVPTHFVVDRSATIVAQHHGFRSAAQLTIDQQQSQNAILE